MFAPCGFIDASGAHDGDEKPDGHDIKLLHGTVVGGSARSVKKFEGAADVQIVASTSNEGGGCLNLQPDAMPCSSPQSVLRGFWPGMLS